MASIKQIKVDSTTYDIDATTLDGQASTYYLNYNNLSNKPTIPSNFSDLSNRKQAYVDWGGPDLVGSVSPLEVGIIDDLGHNKFAFMSAASIVIQYSRDNGATWTDYGASDNDKRSLVTLTSGYSIGKRTGSSNTVNDKLRVILNSNNAGGNVYTSLRRLLFYVSTNGSGGCTVKIEYRTIGNYRNNVDTWGDGGTHSLSGWSGWNSPEFACTFGGSNDQTSQIAQIRLTFGVTSVSSTYGNFQLMAIRAIGFPLWGSPGTMAATGHLYSFDIGQNATFPANVSATTYYENGTSLASKYLGKTSTASDASKLGGSAPAYFLNYNNLSNKPTLGTAASLASNTWLPSATNYTSKIKIGTGTSEYAPTSGVITLPAYPTIPASLPANGGNASSLAGQSAGYYASTGAIPASPVNADWNATSGLASIKNKPTIPAAQVNADWNATSGLSSIKNKPTIPTVPTSLPNPSAIVIYGNSTSVVTYDGSATKSLYFKSSTSLGYFTVGDGTTSQAVYVGYSDTHYTSTWSIYADSTLVSTFNQSASRSITFKAGSNITLNATANSGIITISGTGDTHYASTFTVYGDNTSVATFTQSANMTLSIVAGNNVALDTDASNHKITINHKSDSTSITAASLYKIGRDAYGHVVIGDSFTIPNSPVNADWNATTGLSSILNKPSSLPANGGNASTATTADYSKQSARRFTKSSEASTAVGYYKIATITHVNWSYCAFTMLVNNSYSGTLFNTVFDVRCADNANSLNSFAFHIIAGDDISSKLAYLETKSGDNITKIEIFMRCSRYEHPSFYLISSTGSSNTTLNINSTDWGDNPDKADSTTMTGNATNVIVASNANKLNGQLPSYYASVGALSNALQDYMPYKTAGWQAVGGDGTCLYIRALRIINSGSYINRPICFDICGRGMRHSTLTVIFGNRDQADPPIDYFWTSDEERYYICKAAANTWDIYVEMSEYWGSVYIERVYGEGAGLFNVTTPLERVSSLPTGGYYAAKLFIPLAGTSSIYGNLVPSASNSCDLGSSTKQFRSVYAEAVYLNGTAIALNESNIKLSAPLYADVSIGHISASPTSVKLIAPSGSTLRDVFNAVFGSISENTNPTIIDPVLSFKLTGVGSGLEYGTKVSQIAYSINTTNAVGVSGSYEFGPATGVSWSTVFTLSGTGFTTITDTTNKTGNIAISSDVYAIAGNTQMTVTCSVPYYSATAYASTNLGNPTNLSISAKADYTKNATVTVAAGYIPYAWSLASSMPTELTNKTSTAWNNLTVTGGTDDTYLYLMVPSTVTITNITAGGFSVPFSLYSTSNYVLQNNYSKTYNVYKTTDNVKADTFAISY